MADLGYASFKSLIEDELILIQDAKLSQNIGRYIEIYSDKAQSLQYWYVRRHVLMYQLRRAAELVDTQTGPDRVAASQKFRALRQMMLDTNDRLDMLDTDADVPVIGSTTPTHYNLESLFNKSCGLFDVMCWPDTDNCFWDSQIGTTCY
jgi:hypothetical protein